LTSDCNNEQTLNHIQQLNAADLFDFIIDSSSVKKKRPSPEIYFRICLNFGQSPKQVLVLETEKNADYRSAADSAGCHYYSDVKSIDTALGIVREINQSLDGEPVVTGWLSSTQVINEEDAFLKAGYGYPGMI